VEYLEEGDQSHLPSQRPSHRRPGTRPVSAMPPIQRDLSVAVLASTPYHRPPPQAVARRASIRTRRTCWSGVVLRHLERTLTDGGDQPMRGRVYAALHRGSAIPDAHQLDRSPIPSR
jgi:hypothetical protein